MSTTFYKFLSPRKRPGSWLLAPQGSPPNMLVFPGLSQIEMLAQLKDNFSTVLLPDLELD